VGVQEGFGQCGGGFSSLGLMFPFVFIVLYGGTHSVLFFSSFFHRIALHMGSIFLFQHLHLEFSSRSLFVLSLYVTVNVHAH